MTRAEWLASLIHPPDGLSGEVIEGSDGYFMAWEFARGDGKRIYFLVLSKSDRRFRVWVKTIGRPTPKWPSLYRAAPLLRTLLPPASLAVATAFLLNSHEEPTDA